MPSSVTDAIISALPWAFVGIGACVVAVLHRRREWQKRMRRMADAVKHQHKCVFGRLFRAHLDPESTHDYHECACGAVRKDDGPWGVR